MIGIWGVGESWGKGSNSGTGPSFCDRWCGDPRASLTHEIMGRANHSHASRRGLVVGRTSSPSQGIRTSFAEEVPPSPQDWPRWTSCAEFSSWEDFEI